MTSLTGQPADAVGSPVGTRWYAAVLALGALAATASCGGDVATPSQPPSLAAPERVGGIQEQVVVEGETLTLDVSPYFLDPDGGALAYTAESGDERVASANVSGRTLTVLGRGPGIATITVTATDPDNLSVAQRFDVVASGDVEENFDSAASLDYWEGVNADLAIGSSGVLRVTSGTDGLLGIARRLELPPLSDWTLRTRMGRTGDRVRPGLLALTHHSRFAAIRFLLWSPANPATGAEGGGVREFEFAVFDAQVGEWIRLRNLSGASDVAAPEPDGFAEVLIGHQFGDIMAQVGDIYTARELFRFDLDESQLEGVALREFLDNVTGVWLIGQGTAGSTVVYDWLRVTGTGSRAPTAYGDAVGQARDVTTRVRDATGPDEVRAALMAFHHATRGSGWTVRDYWGSAYSVRYWHGIRTDREDRVVELYLNGNNLAGPIAPELGEVGDLKRLNLHGNALTGGLPLELTALDSLELLLLAENELQGEIPPELGDMGTLRSLTLGTNELTGRIPPELGRLTGLTRLDLSGNRLSGSVPSELGNLTQIRGLDLNDNALTGSLPASLLNLSLSRFLWGGNAGLCAPDTAAFRAWLDTITDHEPGPFCSGSARSARDGTPSSDEGI